MLIRHIHIRHFRSIRCAALSCDRLTAIVGRNGTGKSSFLEALAMFYDPAAKATEDDYYARDITKSIEIAVTFSDLNDEELTFFNAYTQDDTLTVTRVFRASGKSGTYHGSRLQHQAFAAIRNAGPKRAIIAKYKDFRTNVTNKYNSLPKTVRSADAVEQALTHWEQTHLTECLPMRDDGQFFGFTGVAQGYLGRHTTFIRVPAVRNATEDATEGRGSAVTEIMDKVVRSVLATREEVESFRETAQIQYSQVFDPANFRELENLQADLSDTLRRYAPRTGINLQWTALAELNIPMPKALVRLTEDDFDADVERTGHGLQRAFILTMLQHLVAARQLTEADVDNRPTARRLPNLVLAIEEPELYQHPSRQRHMAAVLLDLADGVVPGVAEQTQVIYTTHAPLFVGLDRFDQIRLLRKGASEPDAPKVTTVSEAILDDVAEKLWNAQGRPGSKFTSVTLRPRMQAVMTPWMNEGFFAETVVLVEGETDRAAVLTVAELMDHDLEAMGICVVPCMGKNNMDRPAVVFSSLEIRTYVMWDNDRNAKDAKSEDNKRLLRLLNQTAEDWPVGVWDTHACLDENLEHMLRSELGDAFGEAMAETRAELGMDKEPARKNPFVVGTIIAKADKMGYQSETLMKIVDRIVEPVVRNR